MKERDDHDRCGDLAAFATDAARAEANCKAIWSALDLLERNVLSAVRHGPIMEADIGPAEAEVRALVRMNLLRWTPVGYVYTALGRDVMEAANG